MADTETPDEKLLADFAAGDTSALGELARRYEGMLLGLSSGLLGGRQELAMDAVQETWVRVIRSAGSFAGRSSVRTWVYRIAVNQCRTMNEKLRRSGAVRSREVDGGSGVSVAAADERGGDGEILSAVRRAVADLPAAKAEVLLLCYHAGLTHEQAAEVLEVPLGTLKSRLHAALSELRRAVPSEVVR